jgi:sialate O-acetylesterase
MRKSPGFFSRNLTVGLLLAGLAGFARAEVTLPTLISDHLMLQKSTQTHVWGKAAAGESVKVTLGTATASATADADGHWQVALDLSTVGQGPFDMTVAGTNTLTVHDVMVGEVWVASGQSNMESPMRRTDATDAEIAASADPGIREFKVSNIAKADPVDDVKGEWRVAGPDTTGGFSGVAYNFAKKVRETIQAPVGIINSTWGGTPIEAWMSPASIATIPSLKESSDRMLKAVADYPTAYAAYSAAMHAWLAANSREDHPADAAAFAGPDVSTEGWVTVNVPGAIKGSGLPFSGAVWLRKEVTVPDGMPPRIDVDIGIPHGFETLYWDGKQIGKMTVDTVPPAGGHHRYTVPTKDATVGKHVIALRLYDPVGPVSDLGAPIMLMYPNLSLTGPWQAKAEHALPALNSQLAAGIPRPPGAIAVANDLPGYLFNGMIHPLLPCTMEGVLWYQGEANAGRAYDYRTEFKLLITDWRQLWGWEFPFYFCQICGWMPRATEPVDSQWAQLREAQTLALSLPKTGMAVTMDCGEEGEVHYRDKRDVGKRLALVALAKTYGQKVDYSGPVYDSSTVEGNTVRIKFRDLDGGLVAKPIPAMYKPMSIKPEMKPTPRNSPNSELEAFQICGTDHQWVWADAKIDGDSVVVSSPTVTAPVAARYAWMDLPMGNLYNKAGLPAGSFRTDDFPISTQKGP